MERIPHALRWIPLALLLVAVLELFWLRRRGAIIDWRASGASIAIALGQRLLAPLNAAVSGGLFFACWPYRLWPLLADQLWSWALLFVGVELAYYWQHRVAHRSRWFRASHVVHHSPYQLNLSAAYRLGWTAGISGHGLFMLPLILLGFHPLQVVMLLALNLLYQFWLHTELVQRLPGFDRLFNSPANHRVHYASTPEHLDRNFGGVLIVFDRLFGTWTAETADFPRRYGVAGVASSVNPLRIVFQEWIALGRDLMQAASWREVLQCVFGAPATGDKGGRCELPANSV